MNEPSPGWAFWHMQKLKAGETVQFRPKGNSMAGRVDNGALCTVAPADPKRLQVDDVVLCIVGRAHYLHLIKATDAGRYQIGNNRGRINGWIGPERVYGRLIKVEA